LNIHKKQKQTHIEGACVDEAADQGARAGVAEDNVRTQKAGSDDDVAAAALT
jgi:hypothetical protein